MFSYHIAPIDLNWEHLKTVLQTAEDLAKLDSQLKNAGEAHGSGQYPDSKDFQSAWNAAQEEAGKIGWEGDFKDSPVVFWIPREDAFEFGFVIKQNNNGSTFVISPVAMPWLD